jgi:cytochrome c oxidase subunit 3
MSVSAAPLQKPDSKLSMARTTLLVILGPEAVFFGTLLMVYLSMRVEPGAVRPFAGETGGQMIVPLVNTAILLISAVAAWRTRISARRGNSSAIVQGLLWTIALGLVFIAGQVFEFNRSGMQPGDAAYGGVFFTLIGFHALHVLAGMFILIINLWRARQGDFAADSHAAIAVGTWFWYFVTAVWLALFVALYIA